MWELRIVRAQWDGEGWVWNESFHYKDVYVSNNEEPRDVFEQECKMYFNSNFRSACEVVDDSDILEVQIKETGEPILAMLKIEGE